MEAVDKWDINGGIRRRTATPHLDAFVPNAQWCCPNVFCSAASCRKAISASRCITAESPGTDTELCYRGDILKLLVRNACGPFAVEVLFNLPASK